MERLPYIDEHAIAIPASSAATWVALLEVMCRDPRDPASVPIGFVLDEARPAERFALRGRHLFAVYRWVFELDPDGPGRTRLRSSTWAKFPGVHGKIYRALVIGTGGHRVVVRWTLRRIAQRAETNADYVDVFEVPLLPGDVRTAEQAFRDALRNTPRPLGRLVLWIHRHVLRLRLAPGISPAHVIGWAITRSDDDEVELAADGPLMRGQLTLHREDRRAVLVTRLHYHHKLAARTVWAVVGPLHRMVAPRLMQRSAHPVA
ncbi:MAG TPA: hypothetical protein VFA16_08095 [Mycobacterium sp.]|uniref:hypothetical protein n=1 Tax=Mycobacterium sp. TaxID=1785 RepID=UPI002D22D7A1|nr:hypothetical protein [Mycobacterium sp.]HZU47198.1 hypothetical protein [Mycobacterium sp.]